MHALARTYVTLYERGQLDEACDGLEALESICEQHHAALDADERAEWELVDSAVPGARDLNDACQLLGTATTTRALSTACMRMRPAHELAAERLCWARGIGFPAGAEFSITQATLATGGASCVSAEMRAGWTDVFSAAAASRCDEAALSTAALAACMARFFEGISYCIAQRDALGSHNASTFAIANLVDPVLMIWHQCKLLHHTSPILRRLLTGWSRGERVIGLGGAETLASEGEEELSRPSHQRLRQQLVTMLGWLVRTRSLYYELDSLVSRAVHASPGSLLLAVRFGVLNFVSNHLKGMIMVYCKTRPTSTLIDICNENLCTYWTSTSTARASPSSLTAPPPVSSLVCGAITGRDA